MAFRNLKKTGKQPLKVSTEILLTQLPVVHVHPQSYPHPPVINNSASTSSVSPPPPPVINTSASTLSVSPLNVPSKHSLRSRLAFIV